MNTSNSYDKLPRKSAPDGKIEKPEAIVLLHIGEAASNWSRDEARMDSVWPSLGEAIQDWGCHSHSLAVL